MKISFNYEEDCRACFDNLLMDLLKLKEDKKVSELFYNNTGLILVSSKLNPREIVGVLDSIAPVEHDFSSVKEISEEEYVGLRKVCRVYTKSIFD